jgi:hypothetical protein
MPLKVNRNEKKYKYAPLFMRANDGTRFSAPGFSGRGANARMASKVAQYEKENRDQANAMARLAQQGTNSVNTVKQSGRNQLDVQGLIGRQDKRKDARKLNNALALADSAFANDKTMQTMQGLQKASQLNQAAAINDQARTSQFQLDQQAADASQRRSETSKNADMLRDYTRAGQGLIAGKEDPENMSLQNLGALQPTAHDYKYQEGIPLMDDKGMPMLDEKGQPMYSPNQVVDLNSATTRNITPAQPKTF